MCYRLILALLLIGGVKAPTSLHAVNAVRHATDAAAVTSRQAVLAKAPTLQYTRPTHGQAQRHSTRTFGQRARRKGQALVAKASRFLRETFVAPDPYLRRRNGLAVAGFVLSLSFPITYVLGPILGIVFGAIALTRANRYPEVYGRKNMALAALIIGGVLVLLFISLVTISLFLWGV